MSLARRLTLLFAGIAVLVAVAIGGLSYAATASSLQAQMHHNLIAAVHTLANNGVPDGLPDANRQALSGNGAPAGAPRPPFLIAQQVDASGRVSAFPGGRTGLPVDAQDISIASVCDRSVMRFRDIVIDGTPYTLLTQCFTAGAPATQVARNTQDSHEVLGMLARRTLAIALGVIAAAALSGWFVARHLTRRLVRLTAIAEAVSSTGRLDLAVPAEGDDEVGRLGAAFDGMLGELARSKDDQKRLVQDAGHELKTPLTSIRTNVSLLRRFDDLTPHARLAVLDDLAGETRELTNLINELVELATDRRADELPRPVDLAPLLEGVAARARRRTGRHILVDADPSAVLGRPAALERAVSNLLDNATKFDHCGDTPIEVRLRQGRVEVHDRGPGIPVEDLDRIFNRFHRATAARSMPGSGLGLSIVKDVASAHRGTVFAANRDGGGAVIGFTVGREALCPPSMQRTAHTLV